VVRDSCNGTAASASDWHHLRLKEQIFTTCPRLTVSAMSTFAYAAFASIVALVPIFCIWSRSRDRAPPPSVKLEFFPSSTPPSGPHVVVTGGSGFVGRRIIELLLREPHQYRVTVLDVLLPVVKHASVTYVRGDICNPEHVVAAFKGADAVIHVASIIPSLKTQASPIIHRVNVDGTRVVIDACKVRRLFLRTLTLMRFGPHLNRRSVGWRASSTRPPPPSSSGLVPGFVLLASV
jgi:hypothetical protein